MPVPSANRLASGPCGSDWCGEAVDERKPSFRAERNWGPVFSLWTTFPRELRRPTLCPAVFRCCVSQRRGCWLRGVSCWGAFGSWCNLATLDQTGTREGLGWGVGVPAFRVRSEKRGDRVCVCNCYSVSSQCVMVTVCGDHSGWWSGVLVTVWGPCSQKGYVIVTALCAIVGDVEGRWLCIWNCVSR